ncbi:hypothetical protein ACIP3U_07465 [[Kitasatospora] papulosa]|uniref:hypothetical protein n=1 Tax=[Kitasatospora] papulosa TaxID=1464011 RepID=UPI0037FD30DB
MARKNGRSRGLLLTWWVVGPLVAIWAGNLLFSAMNETSADLGALEATGKDFLENLGAGDGDGVCATMTRTARSEFAATQRKNTCPQAVQALIAPLSEAERDELAGSYEARFFARSGSTGHIKVDDNPLQISELLLSGNDGKWLVTEWR